MRSLVARRFREGGLETGLGRLEADESQDVEEELEAGLAQGLGVL